MIEDTVVDRIGENETLAAVPYAVALTGSRACGYQTDSSDYDFEVLCDDDTFRDLAVCLGKDPESRGITLPGFRTGKDPDIDVTVHRWTDVERAIKRWNDESMWIWSHAKRIEDPLNRLSDLKKLTGAYPKGVLEEKIQAHFLRDFHLSVHGITYHRDSDNLFSVVHALSAKVAEYCRLCCLLDGKPFPYDKWLLRACEETTTGEIIAPWLHQVITTVSSLGGTIESNWEVIQGAVKLIDTDACDVLEERLIAWGISASWLENAYDYIEEAIFD